LARGNVGARRLDRKSKGRSAIHVAAPGTETHEKKAAVAPPEHGTSVLRRATKPLTVKRASSESVLGLNLEAQGPTSQIGPSGIDGTAIDGPFRLQITFGRLVGGLLVDLGKAGTRIHRQ